MTGNTSYRFLSKAFAAVALVAGLAGCNEDESKDGGLPSPTPAPEVTITAPPALPPTTGASDLQQVGSIVQITSRSQDLTFTTPAITGETKVRVTLPEGYDPNGTTRYPVVYLLHGGVSNYTTWTSATGGNLEALTPNVPVIFVMPDAAGNPPVGVGNYVDWYNQGSYGAPQIGTYHI